MKTHNVNPHRGDNHPEYKQVFDHADFAATKNPVCHPEPPRKCKEDFRLNQEQVEELKKRNPLVPEKFEKVETQIVKPDLLNSLRFASEDNTPEQSLIAQKQPKQKKSLKESLGNLNKAARAIRQENARKVNEAGAASSKRGKSVTSKFLEESESKTTIEKQSPAKSAAETKKHDPNADAKYLSRKIEAETESKLKGQAVVAPAGSKSEAKLATVHGSQQPLVSQFQSTQQQAQVQAQPVEQQSAKKSPEKSKGRVTFEGSTVHGGDQTRFGETNMTQQTVPVAQPEKIMEKIQQDLTKIDPMNPPKNYLFSLSTKETNPKFYKNVPAVWLNRIPHAGKHAPKSDDIKNIFNY